MCNTVCKHGFQNDGCKLNHNSTYMHLRYLRFLELFAEQLINFHLAQEVVLAEEDSPSCLLQKLHYYSKEKNKSGTSINSKYSGPGLCH